MTDEQIKKALVCCLVDDCMSCPIIRFHDCRTMLKNETISLLNRHQAEIERLKAEIKQAKSEAIKEFAEKLKKRQRTFIDEEYAYEFIPSIEIDVLLAEMVGEQNA